MLAVVNMRRRWSGLTRRTGKAIFLDCIRGLLKRRLIVFDGLSNNCDNIF